MQLRRTMVWGAILVAAFALQASTVFAQGFGRGGPGGPGGGFGFGGDASGLFLLRDEAVKKELEIVDEQSKKLEDIGNKVRDEMRNIFQGFRDVPEDQREAKMKELREKAEAKMAEIRKQVDEVLLPNQRERLKQLALQSRVRFQGTTGALSDKEIATALGITDEQKQKLEAKAKEVQAEVDAAVEKARADGREKILSVLSSEQQAKFKKLFGEQFKFGDGGRGFGGRGQGGAGTRGPGGGNPPANRNST